MPSLDLVIGDAVLIHAPGDPAHMARGTVIRLSSESVTVRIDGRDRQVDRKSVWPTVDGDPSRVCAIAALATAAKDDRSRMPDLVAAVRAAMDQRGGIADILQVPESDEALMATVVIAFDAATWAAMIDKARADDEAAATLGRDA